MFRFKPNAESHKEDLLKMSQRGEGKVTIKLVWIIANAIVTPTFSFSKKLGVCQQTFFGTYAHSLSIKGKEAS